MKQTAGPWLPVMAGPLALKFYQGLGLLWDVVNKTNRRELRTAQLPGAMAPPHLCPVHARGLGPARFS